MLNNQKIKKMHKLALYESGEGKRHLAISNYYRSDYIGLALIIKIVGVYLIMLVGYSILTYIYCSVKYSRAQKGIQEYYKGLNQMKKMYDREEKRNGKISGRRARS